jgi:UDP-N-acetylmuramoyl-tripeptide--D-alanyl-D-alanine ligase
MKFTVDEVVAATGGRLLAAAAPASPASISTDTRAIARGETFLALRGDRFDGHDFLVTASRRGASCLVVSREDRLADLNGSVGRPAIVLVGDTMDALAALGRTVRVRLACPVIAVTGSCGKTTVKEMIGQILGRRFRGRTPPASFNNQIGVPLTLLAAEPGDDFVLCEFGTNAPGEIARLASIARPTIAVVTLVGPVHLEGLVSIEGVAREKAALVESLDEKGVAILNADDPRVAAMADQCRGSVVTVGAGERADVRVEDVVQTERSLSFMVGEVGFEMPVLGAHQALLAGEAAAAARVVGVPLEESAAVLRRFRPPPMRLAREEVGGVTLLNDAYNANPLSMAAALDLLGLWPERRKVFFCGDMRELGAESRAAHEELGRQAVRASVSRLVCVGPESRATAEAAVAAGLPRGSVKWAPDATVAATVVPSLVQDGDVVLVKGSRAIHMERVAKAVADRGPALRSPPATSAGEEETRNGPAGADAAP